MLKGLRCSRNFSTSHLFSNSQTSKQLGNNIIKTQSPSNTFAVYDMSRINTLVDMWYKNLPTVHPFYAIKCNPNQEIIKKLVSLGCGFDCASRAELGMLQALGIRQDQDVIFAHPCKRQVDLESMAEAGVKYTTFDCAEELHKIHDFGLDVGLVLRIKVDDVGARVSFGKKFGALEEEVPALVETARSLGQRVVGVSFHVGSDAKNPSIFYDAIKAAEQAFRDGERFGHDMHLLDIGGGFNYRSIEAAGQEVNRGLEDFFSKRQVRVIAEPGRYFAESIVTQFVKVYGKRLRKVNGKERIDYWISDGLYGNFNCMIYDGAQPSFELLSPSKTGVKRPSTIWGPTCDSVDKVAEGEMEELEMGDWLAFENFGAYTSAAATNFNGIEMAVHDKFYLTQAEDDLVVPQFA
jgi:ornithine decarboxylase